MAKLHDRPLNFAGLSFSEVGRQIASGSPTGDGVGIRLELDQSEQDAFEALNGMAVGRCITELVADAVRERGGDPSRISYHYADRVYTTSIAESGA